jgi:lipoprotein-releasing system permease protein
MSLSLGIAARFLRSSPAQSILIIAGISVGIAVQVFVGSLITSLQADLIDTTVGSSPHVTLTSPTGGAIDGGLAADVRGEPEVETAIAVRTLSAIYAGGGDSLPLSLTGGVAEELDTIYGLSDRLVDGAFTLDEGELIVGKGFAQTNGVGAGDTVELTLPTGTSATLTVSGIVDLGAAAANERFGFLDPASAADALSRSDEEFSAVEVQLTDVFVSSDVAARLADEYGVAAMDWQAENEELLSGLAAQSGSSLMIQVFVLVAVALGIASTLAISAVQKTRQIGILKAMGMTDASSARIFLWQAALLGVGGTLGGIALGYGLIAGFAFAPTTFDVRPEPTFIAISAAIGIGVALASAIIPSRSTSRLDPIEVIQGG